jgi:TolB protein
MNARQIILKIFVIYLSFLPQTNGQSLSIDITGVGQTQIPIALAPFSVNTEDEQKFSKTLNDVVQANLRRTAAFNLLPLPPLNPLLRHDLELSAEFFDTWKNLGTHALVVGSIEPGGKKKDVITSFRVLDTLNSIDLGGLSLESPNGSLEARTVAHKISDFILESLTGEPGFFSTRIAYVVREGFTKHTLVISDSDGFNERPALQSTAPIISLAWSPKGDKLAYVSYETGKPVIFIHTLITGKRKIFANFKGSNSSPTWSPDGKTLAFVLTKDGSSQIYTASSEGKNLKRITRVRAINTEPTFSSDGKNIFFTSDQGGSPQVYVIERGGKKRPRRVTFKRKFNARPVAGPNGGFLAYVTRIQGNFVVAIKNLKTNEEKILSRGPKDDSPSFAPNGNWLIFSSSIRNKEVLSAVSVDGKVKTRLSLESGNIRSPAWGNIP